MEEKSLISVIIPIYNGHKYISTMIQMMKAQTYGNYEVIMIDDGSTDDTVKLCTQIMKEDIRFKLFCKLNGGVSSARNYGVQKASGDYISFIDVDDYIYPEYLEKLYYLITKYDADWAQCSFIKVREKFQPAQYEKLRLTITENENIREIVFDRSAALRDFAYRRHISGFPYLKLIKKEFIEQLSFREDLKYVEDYIYIYELIKITNRIAFGDSVEYLYIQHRESATHQRENITYEYRKSWNQLKVMQKEIEMMDPVASCGVLEKRYMQAIKNTSRIDDKKKDKEYLEELYHFIKKNGKAIYDDRENALMRRLLGLAGSYIPKLLCGMCGLLFHFGFTLKRVA